jgi:uncharacterized membrane protein
MNLLWHIILIFAAFGGFLLAFYIHHKKRTHEKMVCPLKSDCDAVIWSEYSRFLGIPVEILGLFYYGFVAASHALILIMPANTPPLVLFSILAITTAAFLFSLYLTFIQAFAIKQWCAWCLMSAGLCAMIFMTSLGISEIGFVSLLSRYREFILAGHLLGMALQIFERFPHFRMGSGYNAYYFADNLVCTRACGFNRFGSLPAGGGRFK